MKLDDTKFKPSFSGHETFPLRHGWLKKAYDFIKNNESTEGKNPFANEHAIAFFGVGKNMVISIRHWAQLAGITEEGKNSHKMVMTPILRIPTLFGLLTSMLPQIRAVLVGIGYLITSMRLNLIERQFKAHSKNL